MDLGIAGRTALVCGSTRGLGRACAEALVREGVTVYINGRDATRLDGALHALRVLGGQVHGVQGDVGTAEGRSALLAACPQPDILINNNADPSPGPFGSFDHQAWMAAIESNMWSPLQPLQAVLPAASGRSEEH